LPDGDACLSRRSGRAGDHVDIARRMLITNLDPMMRLRAVEVLRQSGETERALVEARRLLR
jgi:hypothetical protein